MPTYEYVCDACEHAFDEFQSITAMPLKKCPACGKPRLKRLIGTGAGIIFKGSGFYETDYRSDSYKQAAKADADGGSNGKGEKTEKADKTEKSGSESTSSSSSKTEAKTQTNKSSGDSKTAAASK